MLSQSAYFKRHGQNLEKIGAVIFLLDSLTHVYLLTGLWIRSLGSFFVLDTSLFRRDYIHFASSTCAPAL